jgi:hypothetical protein
MSAQLTQKTRPVVHHQVVEPDTGTHKDFLDAGQCAHGTQKVQIGAVVGLECRTRFGEQTSPLFTDFTPFHFFAGRQMKISGRATHIVDISLEIGRPMILSASARMEVRLRFAPKPLVEDDCAKIASAKKASVRCDASGRLPRWPARPPGGI